MTQKFSCPSCGKVFRNVDPETLGRKGRCRCGAVFRLGKKADRKNKPVDLLDVDLLGVDMLGDQLLGGDLNSPSEASTSARPSDSPRQSPNNPSRKKTKTEPKTKTRSRHVESDDAPSRESKPRKKQRKKKRNSTSASASEPVSKPIENPILKPTPKPVVPQVPLTVQATEGKTKSSKSQKPLFDQTYGDLDAILEGQGDAKPLVVRPTPEPQVTAPTVADESKPGKRPASTLGFLAALTSATLAFWFGLFAVGSRFQVIDWLWLRGLSNHLQSIYLALFGESEVPAGYAITFQAIGWILWALALAMILIAVGQFVNAFFKLMTGQQPLAWTDGLAAAAGVTVAFLLLATVFCQSSFAKQEHRAFDAYEQPVVAEGEHLANVTRLREVIDERDRSFTTSMLFACSVPMAVFVLSMVRLFANNLESTESE